LHQRLELLSEAGLAPEGISSVGVKKPPTLRSMPSRITIRSVESRDYKALVQMLAELWPVGTMRNHGRLVRSVLNGTPRSILPLTFLVAERDDTLVGFVEVGLRSHANGCDPVRPVGFIEGWFVANKLRGEGVGRKLIVAAERWCRKQGCREVASDTWSDHRRSVNAHKALGFEVEGTFVNFRKHLRS
jgi:aminoglycoside 6'-N-acetyltransferase I